jgi:uridine phosphorylase
VLIHAALRDEGTSTHYLPPARWAPTPGHLLTAVTAALPALPDRVLPGRSWTTDAPYRETLAAIRRARDAGADCAEMESAALYAYAAARGRDVLCLAMSPTPWPLAEMTSRKARQTVPSPPSP